jgi:cell division septation protein DedD
MAASRICRFVAGGCILLFLAACEDGQNPFAGLGAGATDGESTGASEPSGVTTVERDVEAPEAFSANEEALWDGRPSLGGIWVAHPDVSGPERVLIRNPATGRETTGALFRRERTMPGPPIQVSSDAAAALGLLAGAPVELRVVALRRESVEIAPPTSEATPGSLVGGGIEAAPLDAAPAAASTAAASAIAAPSARSRPAARPARATPAPAQPPAPTRPTPAPEAPAAAAPAPAAPATPAPAAPAPAATSQAPLTGGSFVQVGIFSQQSNADGAAQTLRGAGMVPTVREQDSNGSTVWRLLVGPVATASDRAALLEKVRELGFADAYVIRN